MTEAFLITGGNIGDTAALLERARLLLDERAGRVVRASKLCRTAAWGFTGADFLNQALCIRTELKPSELLDTVQEIERELGRNREAESEARSKSGERYASRPIDIDILFYGDRRLSTDRLTIPHPRIAEREFVLEPLSEIAGGMIHPTEGCTIKELLERIRKRL